MLDKDNTNQGYLCGRLFAVLDKIQEEANNQHSIRERYMNSASSTPAAVFSTILNLSNHHVENLKNEGRKIYFEKMKQEIISKIDADGFKAQLDFKTKAASLSATTTSVRTSLRRTKRTTTNNNK